MAKVRYKEPSVGMARMVIKSDYGARPSLGMTEVKGEIYYLSPDLIIPYKNQARKDIDEDALNELANSIQSQGIIQPLQIIHSHDYDGKFEVISGERRLRAAKKIGLDKVPCMILDKDRDADEIALIENIQREDLHPIELADAIAKLLNGRKHGSQAEIADRIGVSKSQISHLLAISRLPNDVKHYLISKKDLKIDYLKTLAYIKDEEKIRQKVFNTQPKDEKFRSVLRLSYNGKGFRIDRLNLDKLSKSEKQELKKELSNLILKLND